MPLVPPTIRQVRPSSRPGRAGGSHGPIQSLTWKIASISTAIPPGSAAHADGALRPDARLAEDVLHQVGVPVDHLGLVGELGRRVDHAQRLDQPDDLVERAEVGPEGREDRQAGLPRRRLAGRDVHVVAQPADDQGPVGAVRAVTRDVEQVPMPDGRHVRGHRLRRGGQLQLQLGHAGFGSHVVNPRA